MNHADPETMRTRARQAIDFLTQQLLRTGAIEPLVASISPITSSRSSSKILRSWNTLMRVPREASITCARSRESTNPKRL